VANEKKKHISNSRHATIGCGLAAANTHYHLIKPRPQTYLMLIYFRLEIRLEKRLKDAISFFLFLTS